MLDSDKFQSLRDMSQGQRRVGEDQKLLISSIFLDLSTFLVADHIDSVLYAYLAQNIVQFR
jgi:hypothetical protein